MKIIPHIFLALVVVILSWPPFCRSQETHQKESENNSGFFQKATESTRMQWGGHIRLRGKGSLYEDDSIYEAIDDDPFFDGSAELRLKNRMDIGSRTTFETHYESIASGGDTRKNDRELAKRFGGQPDVEAGTGEVSDKRRLMDLTGVIEDYDGHVWYHRLDRLVLTLRPSWGTVRLGRQALTWGNGMLFNPMDLFNPFAPTEVERDYKTGDDMASFTFNIQDFGDWQILLVPRRDPDTGNAKWEETSVASKIHFASGVTEYDLMAAKHYEEEVLGFGATGYLGSAAWRTSLTTAFLPEGNGAHFTWDANLDYSWVWKDKNFYGVIELYYNGLGESDYSSAAVDPVIAERLSRGEMFTLGRWYAAGQLQIELTPLLNFYVNVINNMEDPSGIVQPRLIWNMTQNSEITLGAGLPYGSSGAEFGGFSVPGSPYRQMPPKTGYLWFSYFF